MTEVVDIDTVLGNIQEELLKENGEEGVDKVTENGSQVPVLREQLILKILSS